MYKRDELKEQIIDDVSFVNEEDMFGEKKPIKSGQEFYEVYSRPNIFDGDFDEKEYLSNRNKGKFRTCHMALYGLEKQFFSQINESMFQSKDNAESVKNIESIVLFDTKKVNIPIVTDKSLERGWGYIKNRTDFDNVMSQILFNTKQKPPDVIGYSKELSDYKLFPYQIEKIKQYLIEEEFIIPDSYKFKYLIKIDDKGRKWRICNDITNPKVGQNKYRICSIAGLDNKQKFSIEINKRDKLNDLENRLNELNEEFDSSYKKYMTTKKDTKEFGVIFSEVKNLRARVENVNIQIKEVKESKEEWIPVSTLACWHNFLAMVEYPKIIKDRWLDILLGYENGDITKEQYEQAIEEVKKMEEMFQIDMNEGEARHGFTKPTTYQPLRMRLYGSQKAVNDLINKFLRFEPLTSMTVPDMTIYNTLTKAFTTHENTQLIKNEIFD